MKQKVKISDEALEKLKDEIDIDLFKKLVSSLEDFKAGRARRVR